MSNTIRFSPVRRIQIHSDSDATFLDIRQGVVFLAYASYIQTDKQRACAAAKQRKKSSQLKKKRNIQKMQGSRPSQSATACKWEPVKPERLFF